MAGAAMCASWRTPCIARCCWPAGNEIGIEAVELGPRLTGPAFGCGRRIAISGWRGRRRRSRHRSPGGPAHGRGRARPDHRNARPHARQPHPRRDDPRHLDPRAAQQAARLCAQGVAVPPPPPASLPRADADATSWLVTTVMARPLLQQGAGSGAGSMRPWVGAHAPWPAATPSLTGRRETMIASAVSAA